MPVESTLKVVYLRLLDLVVWRDASCGSLWSRSQNGSHDTPMPKAGRSVYAANTVYQCRRTSDVLSTGDTPMLCDLYVEPRLSLAGSHGQGRPLTNTLARTTGPF